MDNGNDGTLSINNTLDYFLYSYIFGFYLNLYYRDRFLRF